MIECQLCGFQTETHLQSHLHWKHKIKPKDYMEIFPGQDWQDPEWKPKYKDLRYEVGNGATLCKGCHESTYGKEYEFVDILNSKLPRRAGP